jgi:hypothetical protein
VTLEALAATGGTSFSVCPALEELLAAKANLINSFHFEYFWCLLNYFKYNCPDA